MTKEIIGFYNDHKKGLLKDFDESANLMSKVLKDKYGEEFSKAIPGEIRGEFEKLIPEITHIVGVRGKMLNSFIVITAHRSLPKPRMYRQLLIKFINKMRQWGWGKLSHFHPNLGGKYELLHKN